MVKSLDYMNKQYISIYGLAKLIGREPKMLLDNNSLVRFRKNLDILPNKLFEIIHLEKSVQIDEAPFPLVNEIFSLDSVLLFLDQHISSDKALKFLGLSRQTFDKYVNGTPLYIFGHKRELKYYSKDYLINIKNEISFDDNKYISIYQIANERFGKQNPSFIWRLQEHIEALTETKFRSKKVKQFHDKSSGKYINIAYLKEDVANFFNNHISKEEMLKKLVEIMDKSTVYKILKVLNLKEVQLGKHPQCIFYSKCEYEKIIGSFQHRKQLIKEKNEGFINIDNQKCITRSKAMKQLKIGIRTITKIEKEGTLNVVGTYKNEPYYLIDDVMSLKKKQADIIEFYNMNYYSVNEIINKYDKTFAARMRAERIQVKKVTLPFILRGYYNNNTFLYVKHDVEKEWEEYKIYRKLCEVYFDDHFEDFKYKVENIICVHITEKQKNTVDLWYEYVRRQFKQTRRINFAEFKNIYIKITECIFKLFSKEIYSYNSFEINRKFLNEHNDIPRNYQREFYRFLKKIVHSFKVKELPIPFDIEKLNDPTLYENIKEVDLSIYKIEEYHAFYNFAKDIKTHKIRAINDVENYIKSKRIDEYKKYDSVWLLVVILLTNNWRPSTVSTQIPRINLSNTNIKSLEWLKLNNPSLEDANDIIFQIGRYITKINKNNVEAENNFRVGEPLKIAFAISIAICEFRTRAIENDSKTLIKLQNRKGITNISLKSNGTPYRSFFDGFSLDMIFQARKMNRTLSTLLWSVLRKMGKGLKETQISRNHISNETTKNHYIVLSEDQLSELVDQLFSRDNFGYVTQHLTNILFGVEFDKSIETQRMNDITNYFGDAIKIEATAGLLNVLSERRSEVENSLKSLDLKSIRDLYNNSCVGNLPTKEKYYQCIYTTCKFVDEYGNEPSCNYCPASIINVYALSDLMDAYIAHMDRLASSFHDAELGEKYKLANHYHLLYGTVTEARKIFGRDVVDSFIHGGRSRLVELGEQLSKLKLKSFVTTKG